ncbi:pentapeptide repeat-containing protein [Dactylosporangium sp. NPDC000555]|uniref:pentapeptide repeat-containing protein n=1 Tax=Dactylosporangium sp. NPDC000555 TaxID=3154260 RepID=UPI00332ABDB1
MLDGYDADSFRGNCEECFGLCCVAPSFSVSPDFAVDKAAGDSCPNLRRDHRCTIHGSLRARGFNGCVAYDCLGAGQKVAQVTFGGRSWREAPDTAERMFETFRVVRQLQQLLFSLVGAMELPQSRPLRPDLAALRDEIDAVTRGSADAIGSTDLPRYRRRVDGLLLRVAGELARAGVSRAITRRGIDLSGVVLAGAYLRGADLTNANLGGTLLAGADLRDADLTNADLTDADLADANLARADVTGADLRRSVRLTQTQLDAAVGDASTAITDPLVRPAHW